MAATVAVVTRVGAVARAQAGAPVPNGPLPDFALSAGARFEISD